MRMFSTSVSADTDRESGRAGVATNWRAWVKVTWSACMGEQAGEHICTFKVGTWVLLAMDPEPSAGSSGEHFWGALRWKQPGMSEGPGSEADKT